jgi:hypothetical protein
MKKIMNWKRIGILGWILFALLLCWHFGNCFWANLKSDFVEKQHDATTKLASNEMNNLVSLIRGRITKSDVIQYYTGRGKEVDEEKDGVVYFDGLGYEFDNNGILQGVFPRIKGFMQKMPNNSLDLSAAK